MKAPLYEERDELKAKLMSTEESLRAAATDLENASEERTQLRYQVKRLDEKLVAKDRCVLMQRCCGRARSPAHPKLCRSRCRC